MSHLLHLDVVCSSKIFVDFNMAKDQCGDLESKSEKELSEKMSDLSDDEGPEEVTFDDSKAVALKSVKDARDSVKRYSGLSGAVSSPANTLVRTKPQITLYG